MGIRAKLFAAFFAIACFGSIPLRAENPVKENQDRFSLAIECIKRFEGWHGEKRHWPYVGYGHKVLPGERLTNDITKEQGDSILRADLRKEAGDRNIYKEYVSFRCYKGKVVPSIERRRKVEYLLLFEE